MKDKTKTKTTPQESSTILNLIMYALIGIALAANITKDYFQQAPAPQVSIQREGNHISGDYKAQFIGQKGLQSVVSQLSSHKGVQSLDLNFALCDLQPSDIKTLTQQIEKMQDLQEIRLSLAHNNVTKTGILDLMSIFQKGFNKLTKLNLGLDTGNFGMFGAIALSKGLKNSEVINKRVEEFTLSLIHNNLTHTGLESVLDGLTGVSNLKKLKLVFLSNNLNDTCGEPLRDFLVNLNKKNPYLNDLELNLYSNKLGAVGSVTFFEGLKNFKNIKRLSIDLYFNNITDVGVQKLSDVLTTYHLGLTDLSLNLEFCYINNNGGEILGKTLAQLKNLKKLHLNTATKNFGPPGYTAIVNGIMSMKLDELTIQIAVNKIGMQGALDTKLLLNSQKNLKKLKLDFTESYWGDQGGKQIKEALQVLKNVEDLDLNVAFNDMKDYGCLEITKGVLGLKSLKKFRLNFNQNEIQNQAALELTDLIYNRAKNYQHITIDFMNTAINNSTRDAIQDKFQGAKNIEISINSSLNEDYLAQQEAEEKPGQKSEEQVEHDRSQTQAKV